MDDFHALSLSTFLQLHEGGSAGRPVSRVLSRSLLAKRSATVISLAGRLPVRSSSLPESRNGPDQPCSHIWPCSRWGLPSQPVTRLLVRSYQGPRRLRRSSPQRQRRLAPFHPYLIPARAGPSAVYFLLHFPYPSPLSP